MDSWRTVRIWWRTSCNEKERTPRRNAGTEPINMIKSNTNMKK